MCKALHNEVPYLVLTIFPVSSRLVDLPQKALHLVLPQL